MKMKMVVKYGDIDGKDLNMHVWMSSSMNLTKSSYKLSTRNHFKKLFE
jgi:hypothetical protein